VSTQHPGVITAPSALHEFPCASAVARTRDYRCCRDRDAVAIAKEVGRREVVWEGVDDPLGGPGAMGTPLPLDQDVAMVRTRPRLTGFND